MGNANILIVEDEAIVAEDLASKLRRLGYEVAGIAAGGEEAVRLVPGLRPDLVLMDIRLDGPMDGIEAAAAIRRQHDAPVIYLTAHSDPATLARAKLTGPSGYILKPFEERELATQIELALYKHQADREIRGQREWLRVTLTSIGDAVIATDAEARVNFVNPAAESLTGWSSGEASGRPLSSVFRIVNEQTGQALEEPVARALREGRAVSVTNHAALVTRDGRTVPIEDSAAPILDAAGQVIGAVLVFHDVTEKRRAEEAMRESTDRFRIVADFTYDWEYWRTPDNRFLYVSPSCERTTGYTREEFIRDPDLYLRIVHPDDRERIAAHLREDQTVRDEYEIEFRIVRRDGQERWIGHACQVVLGANGELMGRRASNRDITHRKRMEDALRKSRQKLELRVQERTAELETYMGKLRESNQALQDFVSIASHDLQEPLRKVITFGDLLRQKYAEVLEDEGKDYLERMIKATARMRSLLRSLLEYSRITARGAPFREVDLNFVVQEVLSDLEVRIDKTEGQVDVGELGVISAEPDQMWLLFQNIIGNALKFHRKGERPIVKVWAAAADNGRLRIFVEDNGIGFDEKDLDRVFAPFKRLHGRDSPYDGTGMGLAICKKIVERHGGSITAESEPGKGSTFIVDLPVDRARP